MRATCKALPVVIVSRSLLLLVPPRMTPGATPVVPYRMTPGDTPVVPPFATPVVPPSLVSETLDTSRLRAVCTQINLPDEVLRIICNALDETDLDNLTQVHSKCHGVIISDDGYVTLLK